MKFAVVSFCPVRFESIEHFSGQITSIMSTPSTDRYRRRCHITQWAHIIVVDGTPSCWNLDIYGHLELRPQNLRRRFVVAADGVNRPVADKYQATSGKSQLRPRQSANRKGKETIEDQLDASLNMLESQVFLNIHSFYAASS